MLLTAIKDFMFDSLKFKCAHPVKIVNAYGINYVPCGSCASCKSRKGSINAAKVRAELAHHKYNYFLTLTYRDKDLPLLTPTFHYKNVKGVENVLTSITYKPLNFSVTRKCTGEVNEVIVKEIFFNESKQDSINKEEFELFINQINSRYDVKTKTFIYKGNLGYNIPVLNYKHIQLFLKNLRRQYEYFVTKNALGNDSKTLRFSCLCEYGAHTLRPHYHIIIHTQSNEFNKFFHTFSEKATGKHNYVFSLWKYGFTNFTLANVGGKLATYLSSYVSGNSKYNSFYKNSIVCEKFIHSKYYGNLFYLNDKINEFRNVALLPLEDLKKAIITLCDKTFHAISNNQFRNIYFPSIGYQNFLQSYDLCTLLQVINEKTAKGIDFINYINKNCFLIPNHVKALLDGYRIKINNLYPSFSEKDKETLFKEYYHNTLFRLFYDFKRLNKSRKLLGLSIYDYVTRYENVYMCLDEYNLITQLHEQEEYYKNCMFCDESYSIWYNNIVPSYQNTQLFADLYNIQAEIITYRKNSKVHKDKFGIFQNK